MWLVDVRACSTASMINRRQGVLMSKHTHATRFATNEPTCHMVSMIRAAILAAFLQRYHLLVPLKRSKRDLGTLCQTLFINMLCGLRTVTPHRKFTCRVKGVL